MKGWGDFGWIDREQANDALIRWGHRMGPLNRPLFGKPHDFGLFLAGELAAVVTADRLIRPTCRFARSDAFELSRLCARDRALPRVALRLWREAAMPEIVALWGSPWAISYQNALMHRGDLYRFDGWQRVGWSTGGSDSRAAAGTVSAKRRVIWGWNADDDVRRARSQADEAEQEGAPWPAWTGAVSVRSGGVSAVLLHDDTHRVRLDREIGGDGPIAALIGVNPSTADAEKNDQTIRKDIGFANVHGWSRIIKANKFTFRATDVRELAGVNQPNCPEADAYLEAIMREADILVPCWGPLAKLPRRLRTRWRRVVEIADEIGKPLWCFGTAKDGQPLHTLTLAYTTPLVPWPRPFGAPILRMTPAPQTTNEQEG